MTAVQGSILDLKAPWKNAETVQIHGGYRPDPITRSTAVPIFATAGFTFSDSAQGARLFGLREFGNIYTRLMNPTVDVFEKRITALEGGVGAIATSSGQSALFMTMIALTKAGHNIVASSHLYGGAYSQLGVLFPRYNVQTRFIETGKAEDYRAAVDENTRAIYVESMSNPDYDVADLEGIAKVAHDNGIPLVVDNTLGAGGYFVKPFEWGADIVIHSATKWICGHGTTLAGVIIDSGKFDWGKNAAKFPEMVEPSPGYHGLQYWASFGPLTFITRIRVEMLRDIGAALSPWGAHQLCIGLETLSLRVQRHAENTQKLAEYFMAHPEWVNWTLWPGSEKHPSYQWSKKYLHKGYGSMLSIGVKGGSDMGGRIVDSLVLISNISNVGDAKTMAVHPWSTTHEQLTKEQKHACGVTEDLIRVSVGIEHIDDLIADFDQAFQTIYGSTAPVTNLLRF